MSGQSSKKRNTVLGQPLTAQDVIRVIKSAINSITKRKHQNIVINEVSNKQDLERMVQDIMRTIRALRLKRDKIFLEKEKSSSNHVYKKLPKSLMEEQDDSLQEQIDELLTEYEQAIIELQQITKELEKIDSALIKHELSHRSEIDTASSRIEKAIESLLSKANPTSTSNNPRTKYTHHQGITDHLEKCSIPNASRTKIRNKFKDASIPKADVVRLESLVNDHNSRIAKQVRRHTLNTGRLSRRRNEVQRRRRASITKVVDLNRRLSSMSNRADVQQVLERLNINELVRSPGTNSSLFNKEQERNNSRSLRKVRREKMRHLPSIFGKKKQEEDTLNCDDQDKLPNIDSSIKKN